MNIKGIAIRIVSVAVGFLILAICMAKFTFIFSVIGNLWMSITGEVNLIHIIYTVITTVVAGLFSGFICIYITSQAFKSVGAMFLFKSFVFISLVIILHSIVEVYTSDSVEFTPINALVQVVPMFIGMYLGTRFEKAKKVKKDSRQQETGQNPEDSGEPSLPR